MEYKWTVLTVTTVGIFMVALDQSVVVVGLPTIIEDLDTSLFAGIWVITAYRLMITIMLLMVGRIADIIGRVRLYNVGFAIYTVGSVSCSLSTTGELLIASRLIQGFGGALVFVNSMVLVTDAFAKAELGTAIGINQVAINAGQILGYTLGGVMIGLFGWRSIFWLEIPIGVFGTIWSRRRLTELYRRVENERLDYPGSILFSTALTIVLLALTLGDLRSAMTQAFLGASALLFTFFFLRESRIDQPVLDLSLFKIRLFAVGNLANMFNGFAFNALAFELTLYLQLVKGYSPFQTGVALLPMSFALIMIGPISGWLSDRYGARGLSTLGLTVASVALIFFSTFSVDTSPFMISAALALEGFGVGLFRSPNASSVMGSLPPERRGVGSGVRSTVFNLSNVVSIPLALTLMTAVMPYDKLAVVVSATTLSSRPEVLELLDSIKYAFFALAIINAVGAVVSVLRGSRTDSPSKPASGQELKHQPNSQNA